MNDFEKSGQLDYNKIYQKVIKNSIQNNYDIVSLTLMLKNLGYSKKKIQSKIKKYKRYKKRLNNSLNL